MTSSTQIGLPSLRWSAHGNGRTATPPSNRPDHRQSATVSWTHRRDSAPGSSRSSGHGLTVTATLRTCSLATRSSTTSHSTGLPEPPPLPPACTGRASDRFRRASARQIPTPSSYLLAARFSRRRPCGRLGVGRRSGSWTFAIGTSSTGAAISRPWSSLNHSSMWFARSFA